MSASLVPITRLIPVTLLLGLVLASPPPDVDHDLPRGGNDRLTVDDAIGMVRIDDRSGRNNRFVAFTPDGSKFATVVWRGDLERDANVYSLLVFDVDEALANPRATPEPVLSIPFHGDTAYSDSDAALAAREFVDGPIEQLAFLADNRTVTFLGTIEGEPRQVYAVDIHTAEVRALTRHPTIVTSYSVTLDGRVRIYAALTPDSGDTARISRLRTDGFSPYDAELLPQRYPLRAMVNHFLGAEPREIRQYFVPAEGSGGPTRIDGAQQLREQLEPEVVLRGLWAPDGESVLVRFGRDDLREVRVVSGDESPVPVPLGWSTVRWDAEAGLILRRADSLVVMQREDGVWGAPRALGPISGFNPWRSVATDGRMAIGVVDSLTVPPELAIRDLETGEMIVLTDLNPELRRRQYGEVEQLRFPTRFDSTATGWLVKPVSFDPAHRYPLVILLANQMERPRDLSYLIDGRHNLSGHAAQPLANLGFLVLYMGGDSPVRTGIREARPGGPQPVAPAETDVVRANVEGAIHALNLRGIVDTLRVGISGWSRSAWFTDHLLIHSDFPFAAATQIDGGTAVYDRRNRPYTDEELGRIRTPLLMQPHGLGMFVSSAAMADRLRAQGKPVDILYFPTAPHATKQPRHRWRSLTTHVDWWRFWLQDYEDPDPAKRSQYQRWRASAAAHAPS